MWYNTVISWLLQSPLHFLLSKNIMLISVTGQRTGRIYTTPVNYAREGDTLWITSARERTWWRNLAPIAAVTVLLAGEARKGRGEAVVDEVSVARSLQDYFQTFPRFARYFSVEIDPTGQPAPEDCRQLAKGRVVVRVNLS